MLIKQEPKYKAVAGVIYNRATGEPIPDDEPVFILRAKDLNAIDTLEFYRNQCENPEHQAAIARRMDDFKRFADRNLSKMKEPDTSPSERDQHGS